MSYSRDRDRGSRGVGAIAARDLSSAAKRQRRFSRRNGMGDMPSGDCWTMDTAGAYYVRRGDGSIVKVPQSIAQQYPQCGGAPSGGGGTTLRSRLSSLISSIQPTTLYASGTPTEPAPVSSGVTTYPGQATSPTPPPTAPTQPTMTPTPTKPPGSKGPVSTRPSLTTGTSTTSGWVGANTAPVSVPAFPAPNPDPGLPAPASSSSSLQVKALSPGKKVALVGAGIGLLYLLTRK